MAGERGTNLDWVSADTEEKERHFRGILRMHLQICKGILTRNPGYPRSYLYADLHSGPGPLSYAGKPFDGSPLVFRSAAADLGIETFEALFFEQDPLTASALHTVISDIGRVVAEPCEQGMVEWLNRSKEQPYRYGLVYSDPIAKPIPVELLNQVGQRLPRVDILSYTSGTAYKRVGKMRLSEDIAAIPKQYQLIRDPHGAWQWTFILWSNWPDFPEWRKIGFYRVDSERGKQILDELDLTRDELRERSNEPLPLGPIARMPSTSDTPASVPSVRKHLNGHKGPASDADDGEQLNLIISDTHHGGNSTSPKTSSLSAINATANSKERKADEH
jgi:hypothetical protein